MGLHLLEPTAEQLRQANPTGETVEAVDIVSQAARKLTASPYREPGASRREPSNGSSQAQQALVPVRGERADDTVSGLTTDHHLMPDVVVLEEDEDVVTSQQPGPAFLHLVVVQRGW